jgi:hypothetical protein
MKLRFDRFRVLCEGEVDEAFIRCWLTEFGIANNRMDFDTAPRGKGSGQHYVSKELTKFLTTKRSKKAQQRLGFFVITDGDEKGYAKRHIELREIAEQDALANEFDTSATFIPCWHIETWLLALGDDRTDLDESQRYKSPSTKVDFNLIMRAADKFSVPSDAQTEMLPALGRAQLDQTKLCSD